MKHLNKLIMLLMALTMSASLMAADQVVTSNANSGAGTLRQAIVDATDGDEITFNLTSGNETITILSELGITESLTINGSNTVGSGTEVTVQVTTPGASTYRVFNCSGSGKTVSISNMTIKGGDIGSLSGSDAYGGSINLTNGTLNLEKVVISASGADYGGGLCITNNAICTISNSSLADCFADNKGGAIRLGNSSTGLLTITNSTFSGNSSIDNGGGISAGISTNIQITNSTLYANRSNVQGGGLITAGTLALDHVTIAHNHSDNNDSGGEQGGGFYFYSGTATVKNTIIANNFKGSGTSTSDDYYYSLGTLTDNAYNVVESQNTTTLNQGFQATNNLLNTDPTGLASSLTYDGGYTQVLEVTAGNLTSSANSGATTEATDQRGYYRKTGGIYVGDAPSSTTTNYITRGAYQYQGVVARNNTVDSWSSGSNNYYTEIQGAENHVSSGSTVKLAGTAILINLEISVSQSITIDGAGTDLTIVRVAIPGSGGTSSRVFYIDATGVTISQLTIKGGDLFGSDYGGGIMLRPNGVLSLNYVNIVGSKAWDGGGIHAHQSNTLNLSHCSVYGNISSGAYKSGGGMRLYSCNSCSIQNSTIFNNTSDNTYGGGISASYSSGAGIEVVNSTIFGNIATGDGSDGSGDGAGIWIQNNDCTIKNSTICGNSASQQGGGIYNQGGSISITNTIIAGNSNNDDYYYSSGSLTDNGYNVVEYQHFSGSWSGTSGFDATTSILFNYDDQGNSRSSWNSNHNTSVSGSLNLSSTLADNGGSTQTLAISTGSFAISAGTYDASVTTDQRGESRRQYNPTIGAYEYTFNAISWAGGSSSDWSSTSNWSPTALPLSTDNITIPNVSKASAPVISSTGTANCNNLTIEAGGFLTIQSDASGTGSLIVEGTPTGNVTVERFLTYDKWHYISGQTNITGNFSVLTMELTGGVSNDQFYRWEESLDWGGNIGNWVDILNGPDGNNSTMGSEGFIACKGYSINYITTDKTLSLSGVPYTSNQSINITKTTNSTSEGWNLIGNPFCSTIAANNNADANSFLSTNSSLFDAEYSSIYLWNEQANYLGNRDDYITISNSDVAKYIAVGQAFMVCAKNDGTTALPFNTNMRKHGTTAFYKNSEQGEVSRFYLSVENNEGLYNEILIAFMEGMTNGLDISYDAGKLKGNPNIALYSTLVEDNGTDFIHQALPYFEQDYSVKVGLDITYAGEYTFKAAIMEQIPEDVYVYFEDKLTTTVTNLKETDTY
ncbi:MAG: hypothetical protein HQ541_21375, partial [Mariniphaga sp.]|nr:hypothetical protein [Mariniphaga sp.]